MINEDQLEQLAIQWFQDTGWSYAHGPDIAPESTAPERSDFREVILKDRLTSAIADKTEVALAEAQRQSLAQTAALFPDSFQESEPGEIPEGWNAGKFGNIAENRRDGINPATLSPDTAYVGLEYLGKLSFSLFGWGSTSDVDSQKSRFTRSDFLFGKLRPCFHKVCYPSMDGICSTDVLVIRASNPDYFGIVGRQIFQPDFVEFANVRSTGTRMPRANWKDMANFPLAIPPSALAGKFTGN